MSTTNNSANVAAGKPKIGGSIYVAPISTTLPTAADAELGTGWANLGYISEEGVTNSNAPSSESVKAWGGDIVYVYQEDRQDDFAFTLIEAKNLDALKIVYGEDNVSGTLDTGITIKANNKEPAQFAYLIDMVINGALKRIVIPKGKLTNLEDIVYVDNDLIGYGITITCIADESGNTHYEYIKNSSKASD